MKHYAEASASRWGFLYDVARVTLAATTPIVLVVIAVRLVMSTLFLQIEYNRPGFPTDPYGFTQEQRLQYAPASIEYLVTNASLDFLRNQTLPRELVPSGNCILVPDDETQCLMFNERELRHMHDVKVVTVNTYLVGVIAGFLALASVVYLLQTDVQSLRSGMISGGLLTLALIGTVILLAATTWEFFFTGFHRIFFEGDSWLFNYSDTLIRLFPEQFWFDAAVVIGVLSALGAIVITMIGWQWNRLFLRSTSPQEVKLNGKSNEI